jgi:hypothetical protein
MDISDADIARSREDPRFRQVLLARSLEQLLGSLYRAQHAAALAPEGEHHLREGALMAVRLADLIRAIDEQIVASGSR